MSAVEAHPTPPLTDLEATVARAIRREQSPYEAARAYKPRFVTAALNRLRAKSCAWFDYDAGDWALTEIGQRALGAYEAHQ